MSKRRRARLQRLKHSFVVTFSAAAAAGSTGCDAFHEPSAPQDGPSGFGTAGVGSPFVPSTMNPPVTTPPVTTPPVTSLPVPPACPTDSPIDGTPCVTPREAQCTYLNTDGFGGCAPSQLFASCIDGVWTVSFGIGCNPPEILPDASADDDAGFEDDDAGLDGNG